LFEGNYGNSFAADVFHGAHHFITVFRNRYTGPQPVCLAGGTPYANATYAACNNQLDPIQLGAYSRFLNIVGNVLGTTGTNTNYLGSATTAVYVSPLGGGDTEGAVTVPDDPNTGPTLMRWGNCDSATGFSSCKFDSTEVPSGLSGSQAAYANSVPANHTLPNSLYYSATPAWWPMGKAWPPIGPDVSGGNLSSVGGHAYTLPAYDCFVTTMGGPTDGTGPVLSFNLVTCYGA